MMIKIGIDVATHSTGFALIQGTKIAHTTIKSFNSLNTFGGSKISEDIDHVTKQITALLQRSNMDFNDDKIIAMEMSNHANASLALKLGTYAGLFYSILHFMLRKFEGKTELKLIPPREWQLRAFGTTSDRQLGKEASKKWVQENMGIVTPNDDESDALIIALYADTLRDMNTIKTARNVRYGQVKKSQRQSSIIEGRLARMKQLALERKGKKMNTKAWDAIKHEPLIFFLTEDQKRRLKVYEHQLIMLRADLRSVNAFNLTGGQDA